MVICELGKLTSKKSKIDALKENIRIRVLGLVWSNMATPWSRNGKILRVAELSAHLKLIIVQQRSRSTPDKPPVILPERKSLPKLGTDVKYLTEINLGKHEERDKFEKDAHSIRIKRETMGIGDRYTEMQPASMLKVDKTLIGARLEIFEKYDLDKGGSELRWSQGKVVLILDGSNIIKQGSRTACFRLEKQ